MTNFSNSNEHEPIHFFNPQQPDGPQPPQAAEPAPGPNQIPVVGSTPIPVVGSAPIPVVGQPPQPWVAPVLPSTAYSLARQAVQANARWAGAEIQNQRLRDQEARRQQREEAYRSLWNRSDDPATQPRNCEGAADRIPAAF